MLNNIIGALSIVIVDLIFWRKMTNKKINFKSHKFYLGILFMVCAILLNYFLINPILKILTVLLIYISVSMYIFGISYKEAIVLSIINHLLYIMCEVLVIILVIIVTNIQNNVELVNMFFGSIYANILISLCVFCIIHIPYLKTLYEKGISILKKDKVFKIIIYIFALFGCISIVLNFVYYNNNLLLLSFSCLILIMFYLYFLIKAINIQNNYWNMYVKYNSTLEVLTSYEEILDKYKVSNHENKNQLLIIKNMVSNNNIDEVKKYIETLVLSPTYSDDEKLMMETSKIPVSGLRALIYAKILYMKNKNLHFLLNVDRKVRSYQMLELNENDNLDVCKIVGVFLDNAIEETERINDGSIGIELYLLNNKLCIAISNLFDGIIDLEKIEEGKYTTKGEGHGYGLTLVKEIIDKNSKLKNIKKINDNLFTQVLEIEIKSTRD